MEHTGFLAPIHQKPLTEPETAAAQNRIVTTQHSLAFFNTLRNIFSTSTDLQALEFYAELALMH